MGMFKRFSVSISCSRTPLRIKTYRFLSFSAAASESRGPQRLKRKDHDANSSLKSTVNVDSYLRQNPMYFLSKERLSSPSCESSPVWTAFMWIPITCLAKVCNWEKVLQYKNSRLICGNLSNHISALVVFIFYDKDGIKTRQNSRHKINILFPFTVVPSAENRVGCSKDCTTWI